MEGSAFRHLADQLPFRSCPAFTLWTLHDGERFVIASTSSDRPVVGDDCRFRVLASKTCRVSEMQAVGSIPAKTAGEVPVGFFGAILILLDCQHGSRLPA